MSTQPEQPESIPSLPIQTKVLPPVPIQSSPAVLKVQSQMQAPIPSDPAEPEEDDETPEMRGFIRYDEYEGEKLSCNRPENKTVPGTGPSANPPNSKPAQHYKTISLLYDLGSHGRHIPKEFRLEGCEMTSRYGINSQIGQSGKLEHSLSVGFDSANDDQNRFLDTIRRIHSGSCYIVDQFKNPLGMFDFNGSAPGAVFKVPIITPRDKETGAVIPGRPLMMYFKLFKTASGGCTEFTDLYGNVQPWEILTKKEFSFIPLFHVRSIYIGGGKCSLQIVMVSAVITKPPGGNRGPQQLSTIRRLRAANPNLADQVAGQLAKLTMEHQDTLLATENHPEDESATSSGSSPTFDGIGKPTETYVPTIPGLPAAPHSSPAAMHDFTSQAPPRLPTAPTTQPLKFA